ncbi:hypothetical protein EPN95_02320 [Patescibacteria group bacterium]|nr:MAG: hypothetical protein EPN95_02320 [Patescibacteria group bacterium]
MENIPTHGADQSVRKRISDIRAHRIGGLRHKRRPGVIALVSAAVIVIIAVIVMTVLYFMQSATAATIDSSKYQAVFFTNGQVYFGKLQTLNSGYMKLTDIFYLQASSSSTNPQETTTQTATDVQLIKLGSEVHGPDDEMIINKDQVLFFENLKSDGKVSTSISKYQSGK